MTLSATKPAYGWRPVRGNDVTLADQLADDLARRIKDEGLRPGSRLPSIRAMAEQAGVSRFTVVEAYDRLTASGLVQSRRGAGFFVAPRGTARPTAQAARSEAALDQPARIDIAWLLRNMFRESTAPGMPGGAGLLPAEWLDADMIAAAVRAVGRTVRGNFLSYGQPQGYPPLRQQISALLQGLGVPAHPERNLLTTAGVTHGLDLVARLLVGPGDTVLVEDPAWFVIFGRLAAVGARVIGVPRTPDGPDVAVLEQLAAQHRPKLFIMNSVVHNPTGHTLSAGAAYDILRIAERHDFMLVEDDTYSELHPGNAMRLSVLDRLERVILVGGFSKMLAPSLRVGYLAASPALVQRLAELKMLAGLTSPELGERVIHRILAEGQYRRHVERVRARVDAARERCIRQLLDLGFRIPSMPHAGMFVWTDCGRDTEGLARAAAERNMLLAPGTLFSPTQAPSTCMRFSVSMVDNAAAWRLLRELTGDGAGRA
ncbi:aminotransferase-like domain-containing protein [Bordetella genomosp. 9]|uniref:GntR family transcriptional regulator n=1 Tax=Bordetella genomosp. 9 TaxID=1416803 RepID=A0A1W6Z4Z5_9BORD|nr:PLP-dependent aminotransferase family protein [Bordetella genomosp. 9]ARP87853.1 GntR family transcriptional regulator [Bordetella genomosp. 9]